MFLGVFFFMVGSLALGLVYTCANLNGLAVRGVLGNLN
jgi:hypothetical protein